MSSKGICKKLLSLFLIMAMMLCAASCGKSEESTKKKKKVVKKIITYTDDATSENTDNVFEEEQTGNTDAVIVDETDEKATQKLMRELYKAEIETVADYKPEYTVNSQKWDGPKGYVIVYAEGDENGKTLADQLKAYFSKYAGTDLQIVSDKTSAVKREILVGDTNRGKSKLGSTEYAATIKNEKLYFEGGHYVMVEKAVKWFTYSEYKEGYVNTLTGKCDDFTAVKDGGYKYVWGDEFDGGALDMTRWCLEDKMAGTSLMPCLKDENVVNVNKGKLKLSAVRYYDKYNPTAQYATNSSVCTIDTMSYKYGYIEIKAMVPFKRGAWPSFWFLSDGALGNRNTSAKDYNIEVDVFEVFSSTTTLVPNIHKWRSSTSSDLPSHTQYNGDHYNNISAESYKYTDISNLSNEYHIYGFKWTPTKMTMLVDGDAYMTFDLTDDFDKLDGMDGFNTYIFPIFNNFIYVSDLSDTNDYNEVNNTDLPFNYYIDWIRLYQIPGQGELITK